MTIDYTFEKFIPLLLFLVGSSGFNVFMLFGIEAYFHFSHNSQKSLIANL